ncbi:hypothetical protein [Planctellipticum variicoloris]|uniref:hypothetical protein n=1 Tax=Planctellipticum variicoloris TaxID=3064265 RepID=UPI0030134D0F|nr:hypothetical protein SH412_001791 [Planctomycetaceae bacterium SH412]
MARLVRSWLAAMLAGLAAPALGGPTPELQEQVRVAIAGLASPRLAERQSAEQQLTDLGPPALPYLPPLDLVESVPAREALRRTRIHLEKQSAKDSLRPLLITFQGHQTVDGFTRELEQQSRVKIRLSEKLSTAPATQPFSNKPQPFWRALDSVATLAEGRWRFADEEEVLQIDPAGKDLASIPAPESWKTSPESFIVRLVEFESKKLESSQLLRFQLGIAAEPRLRPLLFTHAASDLIATTADNEQLHAWNPAARYETAAGVASREWPITTEFLLPESRRTTAISLQGEIAALVATGRETIVFDNWWNGQRSWLRRGGATAALGRVRITRTPAGTDDAEVEITLVYDTDAPPLESHQRWVLHQAASLRTDDGKLIPFARSEVSEEQGGGMTVRYTFEGIPDSRTTSLIYQPATALLSVPIRFQIAGIPLP